MEIRCKAKNSGAIYFATFILLNILIPARLFAKSNEQHFKDKPDNTWRITQYIDPMSDSSQVMINAGEINGLYEGIKLNTYRKIGFKKIETGQLKVEHVKEHFAIASIIQEGTPFSLAAFPRFPGIMAGDFLERADVKLAKRLIVTPTLSLMYAKMFFDPLANPNTFEMTPQGKELIREKVMPFMDAKIGKLLIEGHTDHNGPARENQIESYQRALTIRQFLIDELQFDSDRVVAVGLGEEDQVDTSFAAGYRENNRRIVIKSFGNQNL